MILPAIGDNLFALPSNSIFFQSVIYFPAPMPNIIMQKYRRYKLVLFCTKILLVYAYACA